jgi:hypothetical protein
MPEAHKARELGKEKEQVSVQKRRTLWSGAWRWVSGGGDVEWPGSLRVRAEVEKAPARLVRQDGSEMVGRTCYDRLGPSGILFLEYLHTCSARIAVVSALSN